MPPEKEILDEDIFVKELDKRRQAKIEETILTSCEKEEPLTITGTRLEKSQKKLA